MGEPYEKELAKVEAWLTANEAVLWPKFTPTQQSVFLHLYRELGIEAPVEFEQVYADQRRAATTRHPTSVARDHAVLYGLTHLILYESGYYRRYVDRERYEFLIPCFRAAIDRVTTSRMPSARDLDLLAELVSSFRLMRLPQDDWTSRAIAYLIEHQAQNGLWGKGPNVNMWSAHGTQTALLALMDYPDELRPDPRLDQPLSD